MATATVQTPNSENVCAYCGARVFDHDPICVRDCNADYGSPTYFCNHACLGVYIEDNRLATGDACEWSPEGENCC